MYIDHKTAIDLGFRRIDVEVCWDAETTVTAQMSAGLFQVIVNLLKQYNNPKESAYEISYDEIMQIDK